ncbi:CLUMA_CG018620, isoform A [Clunio marinus]|uniref:CLUMA_CG018620, isoform A n=1 Tax=Clunio marinus TaxID=568069 RepID=A0A1J1IYX1_9DIPT|nr:CLUMA_CG018620, isoform A [Clunio marinus]
MQINLTNAHPQGAWGNTTVTLLVPIHDSQQEREQINLLNILESERGNGRRHQVGREPVEFFCVSMYSI